MVRDRNCTNKRWLSLLSNQWYLSAWKSGSGFIKIREERQREKERQKALHLISFHDHVYDLLCFSMIFSLKLMYFHKNLCIFVDIFQFLFFFFSSLVIWIVMTRANWWVSVGHDHHGRDKTCFGKVHTFIIFLDISVWWCKGRFLQEIVFWSLFLKDTLTLIFDYVLIAYILLTD